MSGFGLMPVATYWVHEVSSIKADSGESFSDLVTNHSLSVAYYGMKKHSQDCNFDRDTLGLAIATKPD